MKKFAQIAILLLLFVPYLSVTNVKAAEKDEPYIVDTVSIEPDIVKLLESEITHTENWDKDCQDSTIQLSYEDAQKLLKIAWAEAGNQGVTGQLLIMEVVMNRVNSDKFPDTIEEVLSQQGQFTTYTNGVYANAEPTGETHEALARLESNRDLDYSIIAFEYKKNRSLEKYFDFAYQYGDHVFYTYKE